MKRLYFCPCRLDQSQKVVAFKYFFMMGHFKRHMNIRHISPISYSKFVLFFSYIYLFSNFFEFQILFSGVRTRTVGRARRVSDLSTPPPLVLKYLNRSKSTGRVALGSNGQSPPFDRVRHIAAFSAVHQRLERSVQRRVFVKTLFSVQRLSRYGRLRSFSRPPSARFARSVYRVIVPRAPTVVDHIVRLLSSELSLPASRISTKSKWGTVLCDDQSATSLAFAIGDRGQ